MVKVRCGNKRFGIKSGNQTSQVGMARVGIDKNSALRFAIWFNVKVKEAKAKPQADLLLNKCHSVIRI